MKKTVLLPTMLLITASTQPIHASLISIKSEDEFNKIIESNAPSVMVFSAEWCGACKALKAPLHNVANDPQFKNITFATIDVDLNNTLSEKQNITCLPTIRLMLGSAQKKEFKGVPQNTEKTLSAEIKEHLMMPASAQAQVPSTQKTSTAETAVKAKADAITQDIKQAATTAKEKIAEVAQEAKEVAMAAEEKVVEVADEMKEAVMPNTAGCESVASHEQHAQEPKEEKESGILQSITKALMSIVTFIKTMFTDLITMIKGMFGKGK